MTEEEEIQAVWDAAGRGMDDDEERLIDQDPRPYLAHYTSTENLENILHGREFWFSNPLLMNDLHEVRHGLEVANYVFHNQLRLPQGFTDDELDGLRRMMDQYHFNFLQRGLLGLYVFCMSEHDPNDNDGVLSMWRAYGGAGNGAAIVVRTDWARDLGNYPLLVQKVRYRTLDQRHQELIALFKKWVRNVRDSKPPLNLLHHAIYRLFEQMKLLAISTKHKGFSEEREWRLVYFTERDRTNLFEPYLGYHNGPRGMEPKLKFKVKTFPGTDHEWSFDEIVHSIILGPTIANDLSRTAIERMMHKHEMDHLKPRLHSSTIPLRPV
jgi:hypothetical protein